MKQKKRGKRVAKQEKKRSTIRKRGEETDIQHTSNSDIYPKQSEYGLEIFPKIFICNECNKVLHFELGTKIKQVVKCDHFLYKMKIVLSTLVYVTFQFIVRASLVPGPLDRCLHRGEDDNVETIKHMLMRRTIDYFDDKNVSEAELIGLLVILFYHRKGYDER